ncbi:MAG TPA: argininosuccinate synthase [Gammaproteobacteria bacterium]|nr:argininosuccinate synthase [Gammaproteobacteria bacterium]
MNASPKTGDNPVLLAFSGGLDTSFCVAWLQETLGRPVITVTVDTGGEVDAAALEQRALALGAARHITVDARREFFDTVIRYLVFGNVRRGQLYPLCVGAERGLQARMVAEQAAALGSDTVAHGSTAAGNDQVRFEVALRTLRPGLEVLAPVRDHDWQRAAQVAWLQERGLPVPPGGGAYSINRGLWGTTIGGKETLDSRESIPESAWVVTAGAFERPRAPERHRIGFERGVPVSLDGEALDPVALIERLEGLAGPFGIGRGIHLGETILGSKGRVAFEAPAAETLLTAHRELEKLTLTGTQQKIKEPLALAYGDLVHEGQHLEPAARDIEALLASSQARVTGEVHLLFRPGVLFVEGVTSPHSLLAATRGKYGESAGEWSAADALGLARMKSLAGMLHTRAGG